ncbi:MAG: GTP-binding protein [Actinomycetia bacterium]|nr:GTP-binding protein [Actinomycetes bacterium]
MTEGLTPVTIIGGYLGAGKTTLLNQLLAGDHGRRLAVLVNDFGSVNIDIDLIAAHDGDTISLQNGCICCSIADSLGDALDQVLELDPLPDQIVIEASGVADPAKIAHYGQGWPGCRLDAVIVLADAETIRTQSRDQFVGELVTRQLRGGDVVLLTKADLVDPEGIDEVTAWLETVSGPNPQVLVISDGAVAPSLVLDLEVGPRKPGPEVGGPDLDGLFESTVIELPQPVSRTQLESFLDRWPAGIIRAKGIVELDGGDHHVVQRVGRRRTIEPLAEGVRSAALGRIVVIGVKGSLDPQVLGIPE